jgi:hypothetical protein
MESNLTLPFAGLVFYVYCIKWCSTCLKNKYMGNFHSVKYKELRAYNKTSGLQPTTTSQYSVH